MTFRKSVSSFSPHIQYTALALFAALVFIAVNVLFRPIFPIDETRYVSVAWEMWFNNSWLVPHLNGLPYDHKPPLMFWLFSVVWSLFGTSEAVTRMVVPGFALINLYLVGKLAEKVYPESPQTKWLSPLILISFLGWFLYSGMIMFDLILAVFLQLAVLSFWRYTETERDSWSYLSGVCLGLGMLTKGPVIFVYFIPFLLLAHLWHPSPASINKAFFKAVIKTAGIAVGVVLLWAVPAWQYPEEKNTQRPFSGANLPDGCKTRSHMPDLFTGILRCYPHYFSRGFSLLVFGAPVHGFGSDDEIPSVSRCLYLLWEYSVVSAESRFTIYFRFSLLLLFGSRSD
ncbi:glycosyltransferase family 39 protein [Vibrio sp. M60_M31a]